MHKEKIRVVILGTIESSSGSCETRIPDSLKNHFVISSNEFYIASFSDPNVYVNYTVTQKKKHEYDSGKNFRTKKYEKAR